MKYLQVKVFKIIAFLPVSCPKILPPGAKFKSLRIVGWLSECASNVDISASPIVVGLAIDVFLQ